MTLINFAVIKSSNIRNKNIQPQLRNTFLLLNVVRVFIFAFLNVIVSTNHNHLV